MGQLRRFREATLANDILNAPTPVLVCFTSPWSGPWKMLQPVVEQLSEQWASRVQIGTLDISIDSQATIGYKVHQVPTLILFVGGSPAVRATGFLSRECLIATLAPFVAPRPIASQGGSPTTICAMLDKSR
jgi:thioredoxin 1